MSTSTSTNSALRRAGTTVEKLRLELFEKVNALGIGTGPWRLD